MARRSQAIGMSDGYLRGSFLGRHVAVGGSVQEAADSALQACDRRLRSVSIGASARRWSIWEDHREQ